jgi:hypothetical protein
MDYTQLKYDTESDVEQKFVYNLLTLKNPIGLEFLIEQIKTKPDIRKLKIDKGTSSKYYFPDYVILSNGLPALIIEVKNPNEDVEEGYREARLYANEINSSFPTKINPCKFIISTNGLKMNCGFWDMEKPQFVLEQQNLSLTNELFSEFIVAYSNVTIEKHIKSIKAEYRGGTRFWKPTYMLGGRTTRNQSVGENSFGVNLSLEYKYLFNPETEEEREQVINNAYVESKRRLAHVSPIDRLIRSIVTPSKNVSVEINNTRNPEEIIEQLKDKKKIRNQICLLIGSVGSGKSTFIDYLHKKALPKELVEETNWLSLNLNLAPVSKDKIYNWIIENAIEKIINIHSEIDFDDIEFIKQVFWKEVKAKKSLLSMLGENSPEYNKELYNLLKELLADKEKFLNNLIQHLFVGRNKLLIIVLDNCDKRNRDEQLLMFEVANWLKGTFNIMVFLPIRETTYDLFKNEPPLDTVIKDLVFRIDPPLLINVIQSRIEFALREIDKTQEDFVYFLPNGAKVACKRTEIGNYLRSILHTLFQNDFFKKLLIGLTGRNIRKGLEIFLDFCKSGHLKEDIIFRMRTTSPAYQIPNHLISRVVLRGKRLFYDESSSHVKNIFSSNPDDSIPDPFIRISILNWLKERQRIPGPSKVKGYHKTSDLESTMQSLGHQKDAIVREIEFLLFENHIISESQENTYNLENLICITSTGIVLLDLLRNIDYLATVSEDTFFRINEKAQNIADIISGKSDTTPMSKRATLENAGLLLDYMLDYKNKYWFSPDIAINNIENKIDSTLADCINLINKAQDGDIYFLQIDDLMKQYPVGSKHEGVIVSIQDYGLMIQIGLNAAGLVHISNFSNHERIEDFEVGDYLEVEILNIDEDRKKFSLKIIGEILTE